MATQSLTIQLGLNGLGKVTGGLGQLNKAGSNAVSGISGGLSKFNAIVSTITAGIAGSMLTRELGRAIERMDEIDKSAGKLKESAETISALGYAARMSEVEFGALEDSLKKLAQFNVKNGVSGGLVEGLLAQADAIASITDPTERLARVTEVFGKRGTELLPMLENGREGIKAMTDEAQRMGLVISGEAARSAAELGDEVKKLKAQAEGLTNTIAQGLTPALTNLVKVASAVLSAIPTGKFGEMISNFSKWWAVNSGSGIVKSVSWMTEFVSKLAGGSGFGESLEAASKAAADAYNKLIGTLFKASEPLEEQKDKVVKLTAALNDLKRFNELASRGLSVQEGFVNSDPSMSDATKRARLRVITAQKLALLAERERDLQSRAPSDGGTFTDDKGQVRYTENGLKFQEESLKLREERAPLIQQRDALGPSDKAMQLEAAKTGIINFIDDFQNMAAAAAQGFQNAFLGATSAISGGLEGLIMGTKTWGNALMSIGLGITQSIVRAITDMAAQWLVAHVFMKGVSLAWSTFTSAMRAKDVATANASEAAKMPALAANATLASIGSWGLAAVIGLAAITAIIAGLGGFQSGGYTGDGAPNQIAGLVHRGEYVLDAPTVSRLGVDNLEAMRAGDLAPSSMASMGAGGSAGGSTVNVATFDSRMDARKWADSQDSETWFVDMVAKTSHKWRRS
jgi:hypothetical protein